MHEQDLERIGSEICLFELGADLFFECSVYSLFLQYEIMLLIKTVCFGLYLQADTIHSTNGSFV